MSNRTIQATNPWTVGEPWISAEPLVLDGGVVTTVGTLALGVGAVVAPVTTIDATTMASSVLTFEPVAPFIPSVTVNRGGSVVFLGDIDPALPISFTLNPGGSVVFAALNRKLTADDTTIVLPPVDTESRNETMDILDAYGAELIGVDYGAQEQ